MGHNDNAFIVGLGMNIEIIFPDQFKVRVYTSCQYVI